MPLPELSMLLSGVHGSVNRSGGQELLVDDRGTGLSRPANFLRFWSAFNPLPGERNPYLPASPIIVILNTYMSLKRQGGETECICRTRILARTANSVTPLGT